MSNQDIVNLMATINTNVNLKSIKSDNIVSSQVTKKEDLKFIVDITDKMKFITQLIEREGPS